MNATKENLSNFVAKSFFQPFLLVRQSEVIFVLVHNADLTKSVIFVR